MKFIFVKNKNILLDFTKPRELFRDFSLGNLDANKFIVSLFKKIKSDKDLDYEDELLFL